MFKKFLIAGFCLTLVLPAPAEFGAASGQTGAADRQVEKSSGGPAFDPTTLAGTTIWTSQIQPGFIPNLGSVLDFDAGGTGTSYERATPFITINDPASISETFTWTIDSGVLNITFDDFSELSFISFSYPYDELVDTYGFDQAVVDFMNTAFENGQYIQTGQLEMTLTTVSRTTSVDAMGDRRLGVTTTETSEYSFDDVLIELGWPGPLPVGPVSQSQSQEIYLPAEITNVLASSPAAGDQWALPFLFRPLDPFVVDLTEQGLFIDSLTLDALGSTSTGALSNKSFTWSTTADGLVLDSGTEQYRYVPIESDGSVFLALVTYLSDGDVLVRSAQWIARSDGTGATLAADLVQPIPFYWQAGINSSLAFTYRESGQLDPSWVFGYSFANDGTSFRIFGPFEDACVLGDGETCFAPEGQPFWTWSASGDTIVRDRAQPSFPRSRTWQVLNYQAGGRATVLEWEVFQFGDSPADFLINPRLNTLEISNLSSWPLEWADSEGFYPDIDDDGDGIANAADNCLQVASTDLRDGDADGIGTVCDTDHNQDCVVNFLDLALFAENFLGDDDNYDYSGDGLVNFVDLIQIRDSFFSNFSAGPDISGVPNLCN